MQLHDDAQHTLSKRFKIKRLLGKGSFGNVYQCEQKTDNQTYAIKMISKINVKRSKIQCLREQATLLLSLDHPNIVKVYQFFQDQKVMFIKMEYVKSGTLGQLMKQRENNKSPFVDEQMALIMGSIFNAVNYIHSLSILHRDIKPENILIQDKSQLQKLKIADFGLGAKLQFRSPTAISKCGTYLFMAPEIMWNYTYTKAVDVWSCAIIMFMLKKGTHPFYETGMTNDQFKEKIKNIIFPPLEDLNPEIGDFMKGKQKDDQNIIINKKKSLLCQDFISRISKLSPNQRYTAQDAIKHPWITRNFEDEIPLCLHDSFQGFEVSHSISLMMKLFLTLKNIHCKKDSDEKIRKNDIFQRYSRHCEQVNRKDRSVSPLKIRRLSQLNNTRQTSELCELSSMVMSPKKIKQTKTVTETNDQTNPTIMKLNKIFNNLFDKKQRKLSKTLSQIEKDLESDLNQNQKGGKCFQYKFAPDMSSYRKDVQRELENEVKDRNRRKKQRILPLRKKNQFGELVGLSCEVRKCFKGAKTEKTQRRDEHKDNFNLSIDQINLENTCILSSLHGKTRVRRKFNNISALSQIAARSNGKYFT